MKILILAILFLFDGHINMSYSSSPANVTKFMDQWETDQRKKGMRIDPIKCVQHAFDESVKFEEGGDYEKSEKFENFAWYIILTGGKWGIEKNSSQERQDELEKVIINGIQNSNPSTGKITYYELNKKFNFVLEI